MEKDANSSPMNRLMTMFTLVVANGVQLSAEQISSISRILVSALMGSQGNAFVSFDSQEAEKVAPGELDTVKGMSELAKFLGVSVPTANKLSKSGKFDAARLDSGTKKFIWDRSILMDILRGNSVR